MFNINNKFLLVRIAHSSQNNISHPHAHLPPFSLKYIQAVIKDKQLESVLVDGLVKPDLLNIDSFKQLLFKNNFTQAVFDVVFGARTFALNLAELCIEYGIKTVYLGGADVKMNLKSYKAENINPLINYITNNDFDIKICSIFSDKNDLTIDNLAIPSYSKDEIQLYKQKYPIKFFGTIKYGHVLATRGCSGKCGFCTSVLRTTNGFKLRTRSPKKVVSEIEMRIKEGSNVILFGDDNLSADNNFLEELSDRLIYLKNKTPLIAHTRIDDLNKNLLFKMSKAGFKMLLFGIESGSFEVLKTLKKCKDPKNWPNISKSVFIWCREFGIRRHAMFIIGVPGETTSDIMKSYLLAKELEPDSLQIHFYTDYQVNTSKNTDYKKVIPKNALWHYEPTEKYLPSQSLLSWRYKFYKVMFGNIKWWKNQVCELTPFVITNPDIFKSLVRILQLK